VRHLQILLPVNVSVRHLQILLPVRHLGAHTHTHTHTQTDVHAHRQTYTHRHCTQAYKQTLATTPTSHPACASSNRHARRHSHMHTTYTCKLASPRTRIHTFTHTCVPCACDLLPSAQALRHTPRTHGQTQTHTTYTHRHRHKHIPQTHAQTQTGTYHRHIHRHRHTPRTHAHAHTCKPSCLWPTSRCNLRNTLEQ
jgi:hypothetical protein